MLWSKWNQEFHEFGPNQDQYLSCICLTSNLAKSLRKPEIKNILTCSTQSRDDYYSNIDFASILIVFKFTVAGKL